MEIFSNGAWLRSAAELLIYLGAIVGALGLVEKYLINKPFFTRPFRWIWKMIVSDPLSRWGKRLVGDVVDGRMAIGNRDQFDNLETLVQSLHDCLDRRFSETHLQIEKLTKYSEEVLAEAIGSKERLRQLHRSLDIPVFETDLNGYYEYINPSFSEITGLSFEETLGEGWVEALHPEDRSRVLKVWNNAISGKIDFNSIYRFKNIKTGRVFSIKASAKPLHDAHANIVGWVGTLDSVVVPNSVD